MRQLFYCLQWYAGSVGSDRVNVIDLIWLIQFINDNKFNIKLIWNHSIFKLTLLSHLQHRHQPRMTGHHLLSFHPWWKVSIEHSEINWKTVTCLQLLTEEYFCLLEHMEFIESVLISIFNECLLISLMLGAIDLKFKQPNSFIYKKKCNKLQTFYPLEFLFQKQCKKWICWML